MRRVLIAAACVLAAPGTALAAPFGEPPFHPAGGTATCLRATGNPGELVRSTRTGAQILQAGPSGLTPVADISTGGADTYDCPEAAARPGGAGILAFTASDPSSGDTLVKAAVREPGGPWGVATEVLGTKPSGSVRSVVVAASDRGDALLATVGQTNTVQLEVRAVRRAPGAPFGAPETLFTVRSGAAGSVRIRAGMSAAGEAVVAWSFQPRESDARELWAAVAAPGSAFRAPVKIGALRAGSPFDLAVGSGGHTVLAFPSGDDLLVAERAPGGEFGAATRVGDATDLLAVFPAAAVRADGGAFVAWHTSLGPVRAVVRERPGPFGAPVTIASASGLKYDASQLELLRVLFSDSVGEFNASGAAPDSSGGNPRATILTDGRALLTWEGQAQRDGVRWAAARSATLALSGGPVELRDHGAELRDVGSVTPVELPNGNAAVAWADNNASSRHGRVHLAVEGAVDGVDPVAPSVRLVASRKRVLAPHDDLVLRVRCSAACDVRAQVDDDFGAGAVSLSRAGESTLKLSPVVRPLATLRGGPVRVLVRYGAPGARVAARNTLTVRLRRLPGGPRPRVLGAVARRDGDDVVVSWRSDRDAVADDFVVYAAASDAPDAQVLGWEPATGRDPRRFRVRLRDAGAARTVRILTFSQYSWSSGRTTVAVRR